MDTKCPRAQAMSCVRSPLPTGLVCTRVHSARLLTVYFHLPGEGIDFLRPSHDRCTGVDAVRFSLLLEGGITNDSDFSDSIVVLSFNGILNGVCGAVGCHERLGEHECSFLESLELNSVLCTCRQAGKPLQPDCQQEHLPGQYRKTPQAACRKCGHCPVHGLSPKCVPSACPLLENGGGTVFCVCHEDCHSSLSQHVWIGELELSFERFDFPYGTRAIVTLLSRLNSYFERMQPWKLRKDVSTQTNTHTHSHTLSLATYMYTSVFLSHYGSTNVSTYLPIYLSTYLFI